MYSLKNVLKQQPNAIREVVLLFLAALVATNVIDISPEATAVWGAFISALLGLFYVRPLTVSKSALNELDDEG